MIYKIVIKDLLMGQVYIVFCSYLVILSHNWTDLTMCALFTYIGLMFRPHAVQHLKQSVNQFCSCCISNTGGYNVLLCEHFGYLSSQTNFLMIFIL